VQHKILHLLSGEGIYFENIFVCPHRREDRCSCRKPKAGLVKKYLKNARMDREHSFVFGDRETDVEFAVNLGIRSVRITNDKQTQADYKTSDAFEACKFIARSLRSAAVCRITNETTINAQVCLDGSGIHVVSTGIGFFDHMLAQLARHSRIDIDVKSNGDLHIDEHHTVEDVGNVLGETMRKALGSKRGIERFAFAAPLDESLAHVALDLSGRSYLSFNCIFRREKVGSFPTELVEDFFKAFADGLRATIHISCEGRNDHHKIEAIFKSTAVALRYAVSINSRTKNLLPSTKGLL
jgi:imidazoleglycerol-phosphate dehydratase/histidinol-phosphatase